MLMAAGVANGLLALGVGPAGAVGDQLAVVADEQVADDLLERLELAVAGVISPARREAGGIRAKLGSPRTSRARVARFAQAARMSSSARCLSDVSSNERWTWSVRAV
jgi:hypothetical protein